MPFEKRKEEKHKELKKKCKISNFFVANYNMRM